MTADLDGLLLSPQRLRPQSPPRVKRRVRTSRKITPWQP